MVRTWDKLQADEKDLYLVLRFRRDHPEVRSAEMADQLAGQIGKAVSAGWMRKRLMQARDRFADLLIEEVARSLEKAAEEDLEQELLDLELFEHCKSALDRRRSAT